MGGQKLVNASALIKQSEARGRHRKSGSTLHPASGPRGQEWFNPLYEEGDRSGLIGGGLVSACIISASRDREGCGRGSEMRGDGGKERGR